MDVIAKQFTFIFKRKRTNVLYCVLFFVSVIVIIHSLYVYRVFIDSSNAKSKTSHSINAVVLRLPMNLPKNSRGNAPDNKEDVSIKNSTLNLQLNGIIASTLKTRSQAIITINEKAKFYSTGDKLDDLPDVKITDIDNNSVTVDSNGSRQRIVFIDEPDISSRVPAPSLPHDSAPHSLSDIIITNFFYQQEALQGVRLNTRGPVVRFIATGLRPGDIAIKMNNHPLTQEASAKAALQEFVTLNSAQFTVIRNGQEALVNVSVTEND
ncbi:type II secretion system protein GspC [Citrobacter amalonaticus]|uniref:Type II secretion system protein GspC n=1 Tax=Citrobacter amalonaticus TaxID=35703 RepID=A0A2S4RQG7_CITAM|nr:type II secretion system protein GspC [Citrobacter amalonaticus]POT54522.1 type II secretion system protein GspC [Citrobacter amalonaticus]POT69384.1 type II secretion system protein GspC [Citrobacter amalonaticus]POU59979.1 type II secretion system protein GspC [Citrobacter amalonaticus]POV02437.1 type II secretion system protein GspC [Citrobacter amalonaticus]